MEGSNFQADGLFLQFRLLPLKRVHRNLQKCNGLCVCCHRWPLVIPQLPSVPANPLTPMAQERLLAGSVFRSKWNPVPLFSLVCFLPSGLLCSTFVFHYFRLSFFFSFFNNSLDALPPPPSLLSASRRVDFISFFILFQLCPSALYLLFFISPPSTGPVDGRRYRTSGPLTPGGHLLSIPSGYLSLLLFFNCSHSSPRNLSSLFQKRKHDFHYRPPANQPPQTATFHPKLAFIYDACPSIRLSF